MDSKNIELQYFLDEMGYPSDYFEKKKQKKIVNDNLNSFKKDDVTKPNYYKAGEFDVIAFCQYHNLPFDIGNIIKYATRAGKKEGNSELQDLNKAMEYLNRRIKFVKGE